MRGPLLPGLFVLMVALLYGAHLVSNEATTFDSQHKWPCYLLGALAAPPFGWLARRYLPSSVEGSPRARPVSGGIYGFLVAGAAAYIAIAYVARAGDGATATATCTARSTNTRNRSSRHWFVALTCAADRRTLTTTDKTRRFPPSFTMTVRRGPLGFYTYDPGTAQARGGE